MKRIKPYIFPVILALIYIVSPFGVHTAHAFFITDWISSALPDPATLVNGMISVVGNELLAFCALIAWIGAVFLNFSIYWGLHLKDLVDQVSMIKTGWTIFRDVANMFFIFMLLWTAINMILSGFSGSVKTSIRNLIIAAIFINFSFFFTSLAIDASNIIAKGFYDAAAPKELVLANPLTYDGGIAATFFKAFALPSVFSPEALKNSSIMGSLSTVLLGSVFQIIASFVFFVAAILILIRTVVLILLLMLSPLAFVGMIVPYTQKYASEWKDKLLGECLWFPLYMMMLYIVMKAISTGSGITGAVVKNASSFAALGSENQSAVAGAIPVIFNFFLLACLMIGSLIIAKKVGAASVSAGSGFAGDLYKRGFGQVARAGAYVGQTAFGAYGKDIAGSEKVNKATASSNFVVRNSAKALRGVATAAGKGSYDIREAKIPFGAKVGLAGTFGAGASALSNELGAGKIDFGSRKEDKERKEKEDKKKAEETREEARDATLKKGIRPELTLAQLATMQAAQIAAYNAEREQDRAAITKLFNNLTNQEVTGMKVKDLEKYGEFLTPRHIEAIDKSTDKFTEQEKSTIKDAHFAKINEAISEIRKDVQYEEYNSLAQWQQGLAWQTMTPAERAEITATGNSKTANPAQYATDLDAQKNKIKNLSDQQLNAITPEIYNVSSPNNSVKNNAQIFIDALSRSQFDKLVSNDRNTDTQRQALKQARIREIVEKLTPATRNVPEAQTKIRKMAAKDIAQIDIRLITDPNNSGVLEAFNAKKLNSLAKDDAMGEATRDILRNAIITAAINNPTNQALANAKTWLEGEGLSIF